MRSLLRIRPSRESDVPIHPRRGKRTARRSVHPGIVLLRDYLEACNISQNALARMMGVSPRRINEIVNGLRSITAETAVKLDVTIGPSAQFWMDLQSDYDIDRARAAGAENGARYPWLADCDED